SESAPLVTACGLGATARDARAAGGCGSSPLVVRTTTAATTSAATAAPIHSGARERRCAARAGRTTVGAGGWGGLVPTAGGPGAGRRGSTVTNSNASHSGSGAGRSAGVGVRSVAASATGSAGGSGVRATRLAGTGSSGGGVYGPGTARRGS